MLFGLGVVCLDMFSDYAGHKYRFLLFVVLQYCHFLGKGVQNTANSSLNQENCNNTPRYWEMLPKMIIEMKL